MDAQMLAEMLKIHVAEMRRAAGIARAAEVSAKAGNTEKAVEITLDGKQHLYEVTTLLNAASLMIRIWTR